ncbi:MAG: hypothetical protein O6947_03480 [Acidobacteria bacterium]|nr:hypothetical protein [Acidobacteriota bacterium]
MNRRQKLRDDERLRQILRHGDPAADGRDPQPVDISAWRRALLGGKSAPRRFRNRATRLTAITAVGVVALLVFLLHPGGSPPPDPAPTARTIRFRAPGGTRIIWTLDPEFSMPGGHRSPADKGESS